MINNFYYRFKIILIIDEISEVSFLHKAEY